VVARNDRQRLCQPGRDVRLNHFGHAAQRERRIPTWLASGMATQLTELPAEELKAFTNLWAGVAELLKTAEEKPKELEAKR
jgi:hypothetical protein